jgi:hypothetical protein
MQRPKEGMVRLPETIVLSDQQVALLGKSKRYIPWLLLVVLVFFRSNDYPAILAFGTCIAVGILLSAATLIYLLTSQAKANKSQRSHSERIRNDLRSRILLAGLCAPIVVLFDIFHEAMPYGLGIAAAIALGIWLLQRGLGVRRNDIDANLGLYLLRDILLGLVLFVVTYSVIAQPVKLPPSHAGIAVWAVFYVAILRTWQLREALAAHGTNRTT